MVESKDKIFNIYAHIVICNCYELYSEKEKQFGQI